LVPRPGITQGTSAMRVELMLGMLLLVANTVSDCLSNTDTWEDSVGNLYTVGYDQVSSNNQDAYVKKTDATGQELWRYRYDETGTDSRGLLVVVDTQDRPWVAFSNDGGSTASTTFSKLHVETGAFANVVAGGFGSGGGKKVAVIAQLNPATGRIVRGTYLTAVLTSGNTNSFTPKWIGYDEASDHVLVYGTSAAWPVKAGKSLAKDTSLTDGDRVGGAFNCRYAFTEDLSEIVEADGKATLPTAPSTSPCQSQVAPSKSPTISPSASPLRPPSSPPSKAPSQSPQSAPTESPRVPSQSPQSAPTKPPRVPSLSPSASPLGPSNAPVVRRTEPPTKSPTEPPTKSPTTSPTKQGPRPTASPHAGPTASPHAAPTKPPVKPGAPTDAPLHPSATPSSAPSAPPSPFDECLELQDPCGGDGEQTCADPNTEPASTGDFVCTCTNGAKGASGAPLSATNGPAICRKEECLPVNPCGADQDCHDPDTTADRLFDYTCTCKKPTPGSGARPSEVGTRARCEVDECLALTPCGEGQVCLDTNLTADSSSQSPEASGFADYTCSCKDGSNTAKGGPADCSAASRCALQPCGAGQDCTETATSFLCSCRRPHFGTAEGGPAVCRFDECSEGSLKVCGAGQTCRDDDTENLGTFNCSCLPPWTGSKTGGPAECWHDDCRDDPCGGGQRCVDEDRGWGTFSCVCDFNAYTSTNRRAACIYDECKERDETRVCTRCSDLPPYSPHSIGDYNCYCADSTRQVGRPCLGSAVANSPSEGVDGGSDYTLVLVVSAGVALLSCAGGALVMKVCQRKTHFKEVFPDAGLADTSIPVHVGRYHTADSADGMIQATPNRSRGRMPSSREMSAELMCASTPGQSAREEGLVSI